MTTWCNHLNRPTRSFVLPALERTIASLGAANNTGWGTVRSIHGTVVDADGVSRFWGADLVWKDAHTLSARLFKNAVGGSMQVTIEEDLRCRQAGEPRRAMGMEAVILSDWLAGFAPSAAHPPVLEAARRSAAHAVALVRAAALEFDPEWRDLTWEPGRGSIPAKISINKNKVVMRFSDTMQPGIHHVFSPELARLLAIEGDRFMHVKRWSYNRRDGVQVRIGAASRVVMLNDAKGAVAILRALQALPEGARLLHHPDAAATP